MLASPCFDPLHGRALNPEIVADHAGEPRHWCPSDDARAIEAEEGLEEEYMGVSNRVCVPTVRDNSVGHYRGAKLAT